MHPPRRPPLAILVCAALATACAPSQPTSQGVVEATNAAAKQAWEQPRSAASLDRLRDRALQVQTDS